MDDHTAPQDSDRAERAVSRRTVIRTAAHAAWAVPVISAVSAAPAFAASAELTVGSPASAVWSGASKNLKLSVWVTHSAANAISVTVTFSFPNPPFGATSPLVVTATVPPGGAEVSGQHGVATRAAGTVSAVATATGFPDSVPTLIAVPA